MVIKQIGVACWLTLAMAQEGINLNQLCHNIFTIYKLKNIKITLEILSRSSIVHQSKSLICVSLDLPGVTRGEKIKKIGMWSSDTVPLFFDNVRVPKKNIIGEEGMGFVYQMIQASILEKMIKVFKI